MTKIYDKLIYAALFIPPLIFFTDLTRNPYYFQIVLLNSLTVLFWIVFLYREGIQNSKLRLKKTPLDIPLWSFFLVATVSWIVVMALNSKHPYLSYGTFNEGLKRWLYLLVNCILVYYTSANFTNENNRHKYFSVIFWAGFIASVYGIFQYFGIELIWPKVLNPFGGRSVSTFGNPNFLSSYLIIIMPLLLANYLHANEFSKKFFYATFLFAYFAALLCTLTRSSWVGLFVSMLFFVVVLYFTLRVTLLSKKNQIIFVMTVMGVLTLLWPKSNVSGYNPTIFERLSEVNQVKTSYYSAWEQRRLIWSCAWFMVKENPVLGKGWGCFELFYPSFQGRHLFLPAYNAFRTHANNAHNEILEIWSQAGTLGLGVYLLFLFCVFKAGFDLYTKTNGLKKLIVLAIMAGTIGMLADNLLNVSLHFAVPGFLYWWNLGVLVSFYKLEDITVETGSSTKKTVLLALVLLGSALILRYSLNFLGEINYFRGFKVSKSPNFRDSIPYLEQAHRFQRLEVNNNYELANCYARAEMRDKAVEMYKESLRANAGYDEIYFNLATVQMQKGATDDAITEYSRALYLNPISMEAYNALGTLFLREPDKYTDAGIELFKQCLIFYPKNRDIWNNLGFFYTKKSDWKNAYDAYKNSYMIDPDFELAKRNLRISMEKLGTRDQLLSKVDSLFAETDRAVMSKNWDQAMKLAQELVALVPKSFKARFYLGNVYFTTGRLQEAEQEYTSALEYSPGNPSVLVNLGMLYYETNKMQQARQAFVNAVSSNNIDNESKARAIDFIKKIDSGQ